MKQVPHCTLDVKLSVEGREQGQTGVSEGENGCEQVEIGEEGAV